MNSRRDLQPSLRRNFQSGLSFLEVIVLLGIVTVLLLVSAGLYSQIFVRQKQLDEKSEIVNLTGQLSILRQSTSICSCNLRRLPSFDTKALAAYKTGVPSLQIWDPACTSATSTLIATQASGLTPHRSVHALAIDFQNLTAITDSVYKLDLKVTLAGEDAKSLELGNILVYTRPDPAADASSRRRQVAGCVPLTGPGEHVMLVDQKPNGTPGGSCAIDEWNRRVFTHVLMDDHGLVEIPRDPSGAFNGAPRGVTDIPFKAGTYACEMTAPVDYSWGQTQARLVNADSGETLLGGTSESTGSPRPSSMRSIVKGRFTLTAPSRIRLESFVAAPREADLNTKTNCLGEKVRSGAPEIYSTLDCWRVP